MAKNYPNVYIDMCWAWSINPHHSVDFFRKYLHAAPSNKLFIFGGDADLPSATLAYSIQARNRLCQALQFEVNDGLMSEKAAIELASHMMMTNPTDFFNISEKKAKLMASNSLTEASALFSEPSRSISKNGVA